MSSTSKATMDPLQYISFTRMVRFWDQLQWAFCGTLRKSKDSTASGVGGGGEVGASAPQNIWFVDNPGKTPENLSKIPENPGKMAPNVVWLQKMTPNVCRKTHEDLKTLFAGHTKKRSSRSLRKSRTKQLFGQVREIRINILRIPKIYLLLHLLILLLAFPTTYVAGQGFPKYCIRVGNTAIVLTWTRPGETPDDGWLTCNLLWESLQTNIRRKVRISLNHLFFENEYIYCTNAFAFVLLFVFFCAN